MIPSGGDYLKIDPKTGHVLKYYGVNIDAVWGMNSVALSPGGTTITFVGSRSPEPGDMDCGDGPCQRFALYKANILKNKKVQKVVKDGGPATFSHDGKQLAFVSKGGLLLLPLAGGTPRSISTGDAYPTITAPPAWQP
jgi:Tol biopolymer transport system component